LQRERNRGSGRGRAWASAWALALAPAALAGAEEAQPPPQVGLERLLELPDSIAVDTSVNRPGGATRSEWRARFEEARSELDAARKALDATRGELQDLVGDGDAWKLTAPGGFQKQSSSDDAPLDYGLSQELRRRREDLERAERRLSELEVEANLAGVPPDWIAPEPAGAPPPVQASDPE
jgi:hypothetical protein